MLIIDVKPGSIQESLILREAAKLKLETRQLDEAKTEKVDVYYSAKAPGQLGDIYTIGASSNVSKLAEALGIPDDWKEPVKIGKLYASLNSGDRLAFFTNTNDYSPDEEE